VGWCFWKEKREGGKQIRYWVVRIRFFLAFSKGLSYEEKGELIIFWQIGCWTGKVKDVNRMLMV